MYKHYSSKYGKKRKKHLLKRLPIFKLNVFLAICWVVACAAYVVAVNGVTAKGYESKNIENRLAELEMKNRNLSLELSDKQTMERVASEVAALGLVDSGSVTYVFMPQTSVAKK